MKIITKCREQDHCYTHMSQIVTFSWCWWLINHINIAWKGILALEYDFMSHNDFLWKPRVTIVAAAKRTSDLNLQATEEYSQLTTQEMCRADPTKDVFDHVFFSKLFVCWHSGQLQRLQGQRPRFKSSSFVHYYLTSEKLLNMWNEP